MIDILENDLNVINQSNFKLHEPYTHLVELIMKKIRLELRDMKAEMKKLQIKVTDQKRVNEDLYNTVILFIDIEDFFNIQSVLEIINLI